MHLPATTPRHHWIAEVCRRLGQAIDCPLEFVPGDLSADDQRTAGWQSPIYDGQRVAGLLRLDPSQGVQSPAHLEVVRELGKLFADLLSQVARADRGAESQARDIGPLLEMGRQLQQPALRESLESLLRAAAQLTRTWTTAFLMLDPTAGQLRLRAAWQLSANDFPRPVRSLDSGAPDWRAFRDGSTLLQRSNPADAPWLPGQAQSGLAIPVEFERIPIGVLWCFERRRRPLGIPERTGLVQVAEQLVVLLDRTLQLRDRSACQRLDNEVRQAGVEYHGGVDAAVNLDPRVDLALRCEPAGVLGGDLCEVRRHMDDELIISVGDAVGHSLPAALIMAMTRGAIHGLLPELGGGLDLPGLLARLNSVLHGVTRAEQFMTLICATLDLKTRTLRYANAGHPSPFLLRDRNAYSLDSHGLLLGVLPDARYGSSVLQLQPEDRLLFYSDGITECLDAARKSFGTGGLIDAARNAGTEAEAVADGVWGALQRHSSIPEASDDRTLLVVRLTNKSN